jgi:hypothetical protein
MMKHDSVVQVGEDPERPFSPAVIGNLAKVVSETKAGLVKIR